jgi:hypothetical protein
MSFAQKNWRPVPMHAVVLAWLRAERPAVANRLAQLPELIWVSGLSALLDRADLTDAEENRARLRLLYMIRNAFVLEIPPDTSWYRVDTLTDEELTELHVVNYHDFNDAADQNQLMSVVARKNIIEERRRERIEPRTQPDDWEMPILWGHAQSGPFSIIEGKRRLIAYAASGQSGINIAVLVGLSPMRCYLHLPDNAPVLMYDLIAR